jgi:hypothetical protein
MPNPLGQIQVLGANVERFAGKEVRDQVMAGSAQLTASTKPDKVAHWVQGAMERLDALTDEATRAQIMVNCGYNCAGVNPRPLKAAQARRKKFATLDAFLEAEERKPPKGTRLVREGDTLYHYYTPRAYTHPMRCYCGLMKGLPDGETCSPTFCQCSRGFVQKYWEAVVEKPVRVEVLGSCVSGSDECKFAVRL